MLFQREEFCCCNSSAVEMPFPGRVNMPPFSTSIFKDPMYSHCLACSPSFKGRVKQKNSNGLPAASSSHLQLSLQSQKWNSYFPPLAISTIGLSSLQTRVPVYFIHQKMGGLVCFRTKGWVCRRCAWRNSNLLGYCRPVSLCVWRSPCMCFHGNSSTILKHRIVTFPQKIYLLKTVERVFGRKKNPVLPMGFNQNIN